MPGLSHSQNKDENPRQKANRRVSKSRRFSKPKRSFRHTWRRMYVWFRNNPLKAIAFFSLGIIIYLSALFYSYDVNILKKSKSILTSKNLVKGLLLPKKFLNKNKPILLQFGNSEVSLSLENLRRGIAVSPLRLTNCEKIKNHNDPTNFFIFLEMDRLYVSTSFKELVSDESIASVNKRHLKILSGDLFAFSSEDNFFEVQDGQENVVFNMQFTNPGLLLIQGYFVSSNCVYVAVDNKIYSFNKSENYIEIALSEIRHIKKL